MMHITGGAGAFILDVHRLVTVLNELDLIAVVRLQALKEAQKYLLTEEQQADLIKTVHVHFYETGLDEYPSDNETVKDLYRSFLLSKAEEVLA